MKPDTFAILLNSARAAFMGYDLSEIDTVGLYIFFYFARF